MCQVLEEQSKVFVYIIVLCSHLQKCIAVTFSAMRSRQRRDREILMTFCGYKEIFDLIFKDRRRFK